MCPRLKHILVAVVFLVWTSSLMFSTSIPQAEEWRSQWKNCSDLSLSVIGGYHPYLPIFEHARKGENRSISTGIRCLLFFVGLRSNECAAPTALTTASYCAFVPPLMLTILNRFVRQAWADTALLATEMESNNRPFMLLWNGKQTLDDTVHDCPLRVF